MAFKVWGCELDYCSGDARQAFGIGDYGLGFWVLGLTKGTGILKWGDSVGTYKLCKRLNTGFSLTSPRTLSPQNPESRRFSSVPKWQDVSLWLAKAYRAYLGGY